MGNSSRPQHLPLTKPRAGHLTTPHILLPLLSGVCSIDHRLVYHATAQSDTALACCMCTAGSHTSVHEPQHSAHQALKHIRPAGPAAPAALHVPPVCTGKPGDACKVWRSCAEALLLHNNCSACLCCAGSTQPQVDTDACCVHITDHNGPASAHITERAARCQPQVPCPWSGDTQFHLSWTSGACEKHRPKGFVQQTQVAA